jgi:hypothetical protein
VTPTDPALGDLLDDLGVTPGDVAELFEAARSVIEIEAQAVRDELAVGEHPVPVIDASDMADLDDVRRAQIKRRGCVVIRGTFDREQAEAWDQQIGEYLATNRFEDAFARRYPEAEGSSGIWGVYWSMPQVEARQHPRMVEVRRFLNSFWTSSSGGVQWFDPDRDIGYADRLRRRRPGAIARGLSLHCDSAVAGGWRIAENPLVFRAALGGHLEQHDPWDAAHRTGPVPSAAAPCDAFRTFQGWTALTEMQPSDGGLFVAPIPSASAYLLVRAIAAEVGVFGDEPPTRRQLQADELIESISVPIPAMYPGDTVWWHGDLMHGVAPASNETRWSNVMYIPSSPRCPRNDLYGATMFERFVRGESPIDFPDEHFEAAFAGRATPADLTEIGRSQFGLDPIVA